MLKSIKKTPTYSNKKYVAEFSNGKRVSFGGKGYSDYTKHKDKARRERYRKRHAFDNLNDPYSPGSLSYYLLWGDSTSLRENIKNFNKMFRDVF